MQQWLADNPVISYILILAFTLYIFNAVFRRGRLPIIKEVIVFLMMALGCLVLLVLQIDKLPIIQCMGVAVIMMLMVRLRQIYDSRRNRRSAEEDTSHNSADHS